VLEIRTLGRLYCALMEERRGWQQRIAAQLSPGLPADHGVVDQSRP
jgi:hypothetical protein